MATVRQVAANQRNAAKSTGPKTTEGKLKSRLNGMTHGLTATEFASQEAEREFEWNLAKWTPWYRVQTPEQELAVKLVADSSVRMLDAQRLIRRKRAELMAIAQADSPEWFRERELEAAKLSSSLKRNPMVAARKLKQTAEGREWLIQAWSLLLEGAQNRTIDGWDEDMIDHAFDLLGHPKETRKLQTELNEIFSYRSKAQAFIQGQIDELEAEQANAGNELMERKRSHAGGFDLEDDPKMKLLHTYEQRLMRSYRLAIGTLAPVKLTPEEMSTRQAEPAAVLTVSDAPAEEIEIHEATVTTNTVTTNTVTTNTVVPDVVATTVATTAESDPSADANETPKVETSATPATPVIVNPTLSSDLPKPLAVRVDSPHARSSPARVFRGNRKQRRAQAALARRA